MHPMNLQPTTLPSIPFLRREDVSLELEFNGLYDLLHLTQRIYIN